jgi:hypothetical protein
MTILVRIQNMKKIVKKKPQIFPLKQKKITNQMIILVIIQNLKMRPKKKYFLLDKTITYLMKNLILIQKMTKNEK